KHLEPNLTIPSEGIGSVECIHTTIKKLNNWRGTGGGWLGIERIGKALKGHIVVRAHSCERPAHTDFQRQRRPAGSGQSIARVADANNERRGFWITVLLVK